MDFLIWTRYPFVRACLAFIAGIACTFWLLPDIPIPLEPSGTPLPLFLPALLLTLWGILRLWTTRKKKIKLSGLSVSLAFYLLGLLHPLLYDARNHPLHLSHMTPEHIEAVHGVVSSEPSYRHGHTRFQLRIEQLWLQGQWKHGKGNLYVTLKDSVAVLPSQLLVVHGKPQSPQAPDTPYHFDFASLLTAQQTYFTLYSKHAPVFCGTSGHWILSLQYYATLTSRKLESMLRDKISSNRTRALLTGLLIGKRSDFTPEDRQLFTSSGTIHVLAVSGMHVVLIYQCMIGLSLLLGIRSQHPAFLLFTFLFLWFYIFITGLNPSACRAALMLSLVLLGNLFHRKGPTTNSLFAVAFIMLLYNPHYLKDAGFILSFLAVGGILISSLVPVSEGSKIKVYLRDSSLISTFAQAVTFPYSIHLFHQFPVYFLPANLIVVPLTTALLFLSIALLVLFPIPLLTDALALLIEALTSLLFILMKGLEQLPGHLIKGISLSAMEMVMLYVLLICLLLLFISRRIHWLWPTAGISMALVCSVQYRMLHSYFNPTCFSTTMAGKRNFIVAYGKDALVLKAHETPLSSSEELFLSEHFIRTVHCVPMPSEGFRLHFNERSMTLRPCPVAKKSSRKGTSAMDYKVKYLYLESNKLSRDSFYLEPKSSLYRHLFYEVDSN